MKYIALIGFALILFIPPIVSIIISGGRQSPSQILRENMKYDKEFWEDEECLNCGEEKEQ